LRAVLSFLHQRDLLNIKLQKYELLSVFLKLSFQYVQLRCQRQFACLFRQIWQGAAEKGRAMIIGSEFIFLNKAVSTNDIATEYVKSGRACEGTVIRAGFQSAGKGQRGNRWESEDGKNLLFSIILFPWMVEPADQFILSEFISLGISDYLKTVIPGCKIKWPNDIYAADDKIAGILIENSIAGNTIASTVAGIGVNINQEVFPGLIPNPGSLKMITGTEFNTSTCLEELLKCLDLRYKELIKGEWDRIRNDYAASLYRRGEWHDYMTVEGIFRGRIVSVNDQGCLVVENKSGKTRKFTFKEIEFKI